MYKIVLIIVVSFYCFTLSAQKKIARYYVSGKLFCAHTFYINPDRVELSYMTVLNTHNYKGSNYTSCSTCRYENNFGVTVMSFQDQNLDNSFNLYITYLDKQNCVLVFESADKDSDKIEIYLAKEVISSK